MKIALVSEGTYPFAAGGVSVWCHQLIEGMPEHDWEMVALTVDDTERPQWPRPANLRRISTIPLWGPRPAGRGPQRAPGKDFMSAYAVFLSALLSPLAPRTDQATVNRSRFLLALRLMHDYAIDGGDLSSAFAANPVLSMTMEAWHGLRAAEVDGVITLGDAVGALRLIEHMLRPLAVPPPEVDLVHCSMNGLSSLVGMTAKWRHGVPMVMSEHGIYLRERYLGYLDDDAPHAVKVLLLSFFRSLAGAAYHLVDALAPHSQYNRRWQLHNGADPDRMWTMYNGVEPDAFPVAQSEPDEPTIVYVGRIDPLKDLHTLIRAFAQVRQAVPDARLRIFGGTTAANQVYRDSCQRLIDDLGLSRAAVLEGRASRQADAYHRGRVVALTSISEGFPYTVVEAMACGLPVVCTNVGGVAEAVAEAGYVVPARDHGAVARACIDLLRDDELRARLGALARERVLAHFTLTQSLDAYRRIYDDLASEAAADAAGEGAGGTAGGAHRRHSARGRASVGPTAIGALRTVA